MAKIEELMENEEFISKLEKCETEDAANALYEEYNLEKTDVNDAEFSEEELENVAGGFAISAGMAALIIAAAPIAWKAGAKYGVLVRANYDYKKYGDMYRSYSKKEVDSAYDYFSKITK